MTEITVTDDQARTITAATSPVIVRDASGRLLGELVPTKDDVFTPEEIQEALRRRNRPGKRFTTAEVIAHLNSLSSK